MSTTNGLIEAQSARFADLDPLLPPASRPPEGDVITAALANGTRVAGVVTHSAIAPDSITSLWSALDVWELHPLVGTAGPAGLDALLAQWRRMLDRRMPGPDSSCVVSWPSRDGEATRVFLDHGLVPLSSLGVRTARAVPPEEFSGPRALTVRRATPRDLETVHQLALAELSYSALVGGTVLRPSAADLKRQSLRRRIEQGDPVWLAERDGIAVGLAECWFTDSEPGTWTATRVPLGRWGYVNCLSVAPGARGAGVGQRLMSVVHTELNRHGVVGTFLYYNPPNPLSSVFWPRQGYRPLWTIWEVRPADALR